MGNFGFWMGIGAAQAAAQSFRVPIEGAGPGGDPLRSRWSEGLPI
jgi:hypothetical protein